MRTARDVTHNGRQDSIQMDEDYESSAVKYANMRLEKELNGGDMSKGGRFPDPEEIRRLTQGMKREHWQPKAKDAEGKVLEWLRHFGDIWKPELEQIGVHYNEMRWIAPRLGLRKEIRHTGRKEIYAYFLPTEGKRA